MQPVQHAPVTHLPFVQAVPSGLIGSAQTPPAQVEPVLHSERQLVHVLPAAPQNPGKVPARQRAPSRQPVQHAPSRHLPPVQAIPLLFAVRVEQTSYQR